MLVFVSSISTVMEVNSDSILGSGDLASPNMMSSKSNTASEISGGGSYYTLQRTTTCKRVQSNEPNDPIEETEAFRRSDSDAYVWLHLTNVYRELNVKWKFFDPDGNMYWEPERTVPDPASEGYEYWAWYKCWNGIYIQGYMAEDMEGLWTAEVYIDEGSGYQWLAKEQFVIGYWVTFWTIAKDVQSFDPYEPIDPTTSFWNTDTQVFGWIRLDELAESIDIRWEWYEPSGALYFSYEFTTDDPATDGSLFWNWYKLNSYIFIRDQEAASKIGQWQLNAYIKDVYGDWDLEFSEFFTISERVPTTTSSPPSTTTSPPPSTTTSPPPSTTSSPPPLIETITETVTDLSPSFIDGFEWMICLFAMTLAVILPFKKQRKK